MFLVNLKHAKSSPVSTGCMAWITYDLVNQQGNRKIVRILVVLLGGEVCHCCQDLGCRTGLFLLIPVIGCICNFKRKRISLQNPPTTTVCRIEFLEKMHQQALRQLRTSREELKNDNLRASTRPFLKAKTMGHLSFRYACIWLYCIYEYTVLVYTYQKLHLWQAAWYNVLKKQSWTTHHSI